MSLKLFALLCSDIKEGVAHKTDHFADVYVYENIAYFNDNVMTFKSLQLTPGCFRGIQYKKRDILTF